MDEEPIASLSEDDRSRLLRLARESVEAAAAGKRPPRPRLADLPPALARPAACFVTLRQRESGDLRGCTGVLAARQPLALEVAQTAAQTALNDPRFPPVFPPEVPHLEVEISILTPSRRLDVPHPDALPDLIRPGIDGVTLRRGAHRATFLPQVWERIPDPVEFLTLLCRKMGLNGDAWREPGMEVEVYQVEEFAD